MVADIAYMQDQQQALSRMQRLFAAQQRAFRQQPLPSADHRIEMLKALKEALLNHQQALIEAISQDFGRRSADETRRRSSTSPWA